MINIKNRKGTSGGVGFFGLLTIVLIVLKLLGYIHISWLWVFSPIIAGTAIVIVFLILWLLYIIFIK